MLKFYFESFENAQIAAKEYAIIHYRSRAFRNLAKRLDIPLAIRKIMWIQQDGRPAHFTNEVAILGHENYFQHYLLATLVITFSTASLCDDDE